MDAEAPRLNLDRERRYAELDAAIKHHEADIETLKAEKTALETILLDDWAEAGIPKAFVDEWQLYLHHTVVATTPQGTDAAVALLKASEEYRGMVRETVNSQTLSALVREKLNDGGLPPEWEEVIGSFSRTQIRVKKA